MKQNNSISKDSFKIKNNPKKPFANINKMPEPEPKPVEIKTHKETKVEEVAEDLKVNLPNVNLPLPLKLIALFTLIGGLSALGSAFADIFNPEDFTFKSYILRLIAGGIFVIISYGLVRKQNWSTWLYGIMVFVSLFINWPLSILPAIIVIYMYFNRKYLYPSIFDKLFNKATTAIASRLK
jgi:hypothetical protein